ncbi:MAG TPA: AI-2E family transporter, partial [Ktedonobacteraceae bacterium]
MRRVPAGEDTVDQEKLVALQRRAQPAWLHLWTRIQSITPSGLVRFSLVLLALWGLFWLITSAFQSLATFLIGIMIAYITLPVVNWLDHFLPRSLAVLLVILGEIAFVGLFLALLIPAVIQQISTFLQSMPNTQQAQAYFNQLAQQARTLPEPVRVFLRGWLEQATVNLQHNLSGYIQGLFSAVVRSIFGLLSTFSFLLGLLVIPTWIFAVLNDHRKGVQAIDRLLPEWLRADFWAVARIFDRTFRVYFRELFVMSVTVGIVTYLGLIL